MSPKENDSKEDQPTKVNKWDASAVKNSLDDAVKDVLIKKYDYKENYRLIDGRLIICTLAVLVALYALAWDYLEPFPKSRSVLIVCVVCYFILMGILTMYTTCIEKGIFAVVEKKSPTNQRIYFEISSSMKKYDDIYTLQIDLVDGKRRRVSKTVETSVADFIDINGCIVNDNITSTVTKIHNALLDDKKDK